jgi:hypothetical protein
MSNAEKQVLIIKGVVTPRGQKVEDAYPTLIGDVRLKSSTLNIGDIAAGENQKSVLSVANVSAKDIVLTFVNLPSYITAETKKLKAGEKANIIITFNSAKYKKWGNFNQDIQFITGEIKDKKAPKYKLNVTGNIFEKFSEEQIKNGPAISIANEFTAGEIAKGKKITVSMKFKNTGKSDLFVRTVTCEDKAISFSTGKGIAPGKEGKIKVTIDATNLQPNDYRKTINLTLNDPQNVRKSIVLSFKVK